MGEPHGKNHRCRSCDEKQYSRLNPRKNAISRLAAQIAGSPSKLYSLDKAERLTIRETARRLYEHGKDAVSAERAEASVREGFVYIITNRAWPHAVKIGRAFDPDARLSGYQTGTPYRDYELQYAVYFEDCYEAERTIHRRLDADRLEGEWFQFPLEDAIDAIDQLREQRPCGQS